MTPHEKFINQLPENVRMSFFVRNNGYNRWPNNVIPYAFSDDYDNSERENIRFALSELEKKISSCFRFVKRTHQNHYVLIQRLGGCYSALGRRGGAQTLSLGSYCLGKSTIQHEFMHAIGIHHEHQRPDRDNHIRVNYKNIAPHWKSSFSKENSNYFNTKGFKYDVHSIMHYEGRMNGRHGIVVTMRDLNTGNPVPKNRELTNEDIRKIKFIGNC